jgi:hypothetical protein
MAFLLSRINSVQTHAVFRAVDRHTDHGFGNATLLSQYFESIQVKRWNQPIAGLPFCGNSQAENIGLVSSVLTRILREKARKMQLYDMSDVDEHWLLICASGETSCDRMGPELVCDGVFNRPEVKSAAQAAGFDRVILWERVREWSRDISVG